MEVQVLLRGGRSVLSPPIEELRLRHLRDHVGAFLALPGKMKVRQRGRRCCQGTAFARPFSCCVGSGGTPAIDQCLADVSPAADAPLQGVSDLSERPGFFRWVADAHPAAVAKVRPALRLQRRGCLHSPAPEVAWLHVRAALWLRRQWCMPRCRHMEFTKQKWCCLQHYTSSAHTLTHSCAHKVYDASEVLFARVADEAKRLRSWAALAWADAAVEAGSGGGGGLEALVEERCHSLEDWEANLKGIKVRPGWIWQLAHAQGCLLL